MVLQILLTSDFYLQVWAAYTSEQIWGKWKNNNNRQIRPNKKQKTKTKNEHKHNTTFLSCLHLKADFGQIKQQQQQQQQQRTDKSQQTKKQKGRKKYQTQHIILRAEKPLVPDKLVLVPNKHEFSMRNVTRSSQRFLNETLLKAAISVRQKASLGRCQRCECYTEEPPFKGAAKVL